MYENKQIFLSYVAVSKSQAVSGLIDILNQLEQIKIKTTDSDQQKHIFMNLYIQENKFEYSYTTLVTTLENKLITLGHLILNSEPKVEKFRLGTIRDETR